MSRQTCDQAESNPNKNKLARELRVKDSTKFKRKSKGFVTNHVNRRSFVGPGLFFNLCPIRSSNDSNLSGCPEADVAKDCFRRLVGDKFKLLKCKITVQTVSLGTFLKD